MLNQSPAEFNEIPPHQPSIKEVTVNDLLTEVTPPKRGESIIVLQRNAKDIRVPDSPDFGALEPDAAQETQQNAKTYFDQLFGGLSEEEKKSLNILVVASDATLITPQGLTSPRQRAVETANEVMTGLKESMADNALSEQQLLNRSGTPVKLTQHRLTDLKMIEESPDFVKFLVKKYGSGAQFWEAYENDAERDTRLQMKAEGPMDIADRVHGYLSVLAHALDIYHQHHPNRRVVVWAVSHYDAISPYIKKYIAKIEGEENLPYLPVKQGAGVVLKVGQDHQKAVTTISGQQYPVSLTS